MKKILTYICVLVVAFSMLMPVTSFADGEVTPLPNLESKTTYKIPDSMNHSHWCITYANTFMLMRKAVMLGSGKWNTITPEILGSAKGEDDPAGMRYLTMHIKDGKYSYTNDGVTYTVTRDKTTIKNMTESQRAEYLSGLLASHPEGVVVYGSDAQKDGDGHAVLLVRYENGKFYCVDSVRNRGKKNYGVELLDSSTMDGLKRVYWTYVLTSVTGTVATPVNGTTATAPAPAPTASTLTASGYSYPSKLAFGKGFTIKGTVKSNYNISNVSVAVVNSSGTTVQSKSVNPKAKSYSLGKLDSYIKFGKLLPGSYHYKITAQDDQKSVTLADKTFSVSNATKLCSLSLSYPTSIKKGKGFSLKGYVLSNKNLKKVTVGVYNTKGKTKTSASASVSGKKVYNINSLDSKIKFGKLSKGTYYYKVIVKDSSKQKTLLNKKFKVK